MKALVDLLPRQRIPAQKDTSHRSFYQMRARKLPFRPAKAISTPWVVSVLRYVVTSLIVQISLAELLCSVHIFKGTICRSS
jgi:hypothetical protein